MKTTKLLTVLMILALIFSLSACGAADKNNDDDMGSRNCIVTGGRAGKP